MFHCACRQEGIDVIFPLSKLFAKEKISFHYFRSIEELLVLSQRYQLDLAIIAGQGDFAKELEMVQLMKNHIFLAIIPTVLYHPDPTETILLTAYENGVDQFIHGSWRDRLFESQLRMVARRSHRDISVNPSTWLPGPGLIEKEIERLLKMEADFGICYADIDDFKAYNDYYGYYYGDRVIRLTARIIRDVVFDLCREGFVGHIGGDDFIFILPVDLAGPACANVIKTFDTIVPYRYADEDRLKGSIETRNRRGEMEKFTLLSLSIAVLINQKGAFRHVGEMSHMLADLKKYSKSLKGSNYVVERRRKY
jgi:diguanylate cyclase (GGDEF)-like protein